MERNLPLFKIADTDFYVDIHNMALIEKGNPENIIAIDDMEDKGAGYSFYYDIKKKNIPSFHSKPEDIIHIRLPDMVHLDAEGMALKYGLSIGELKGKTDYEVMVDQKVFEERVRYGKLPEVDIAGWAFYVDLRMDMLRPKDDFLSKGIVFSEIDHWYNEETGRYVVPYNKKTHEAATGWNYNEALSIPQNVICISFPGETVLDPIGWNRMHGRDLTFGLKKTGIRSRFTAGVVPWGKTEIYAQILLNRKLAWKPDRKDKGPEPYRGRKP